MGSPGSVVIGLLHPGEMGSAVGRCLTERGYLAIWASAGRSPQTAARAATAGLRDAGTVSEVARQSEVILSICPPHAALDVAVAAQGFRGLYVDANAVSPATARKIASVVSDGGATYVDGGIIGPPPRERGSTRLYLSGPQAAAAARLFDGTALDARPIAGEPYSASS